MNKSAPDESQRTVYCRKREQTAKMYTCEKMMALRCLSFSVRSKGQVGR